MNEALFGIPNIEVYLVLGILIFFIILESIGGYLHKSNRNSEDWIQELRSFLFLSLFTKPLIIFAVLILGNIIFPNTHSIVSGQSIWITLPIFLFVDDFLQYWYHRSAHEYNFLWKLHRPHHQAEEMGFFVSYRNAALYYLLMPNIWWIGIFTFLGGAQAVAIGLVLKQLVIISSHSTLSYDKVLYQKKVLRPLATLIERIFITPAFHHAHHGKSQLDGISDPNRNFGNMFSIWDQLFGTAMYTRQFPIEYGLVNNPKEHWSASCLYPMVTSHNSQSELSKGYEKKQSSTSEPIMVELLQDKNYLWCQCGFSKTQPFCDGSHQGTKYKPILFAPNRTGTVKLCNCKISKTSPFCDNSHLTLQQ